MIYKIFSSLRFAGKSWSSPRSLAKGMVISMGWVIKGHWPIGVEGLESAGRAYGAACRVLLVHGTSNLANRKVTPKYSKWNPRAPSESPRCRQWAPRIPKRCLESPKGGSKDTKTMPGDALDHC